MPDGTLDTGFAGTGAKVVSVGDSSVVLIDSVASSDGGLVVAGIVQRMVPQAVVCKLTAAGELDDQFGAEQTPGCRLLIDETVTQDTFGVAIARTADDRYMVAMTSGAGTIDDIFLTRLMNDGDVDYDFNEDGAAGLSAINSLNVSEIAVRPDGRIVVVGTLIATENDHDIYVAETSADGDVLLSKLYAIDIGFEENIDTPTALGLRENGEIIIAGDASLAGGKAGILLRLDEFLDFIQPSDTQFPPPESFNSSGAFVLCDACTSRRVTDIAVLSDGGVMLVGDWNAGADEDAFALRLNADWELDTTFDGGGDARPDFDMADQSEQDDIAPTISLQCGDRPVIATRRADNAITSGVMTTRLLGGSVFCDDFED